jgi:hypothetical protein
VRQFRQLDTNPNAGFALSFKFCPKWIREARFPKNARPDLARNRVR